MTHLISAALALAAAFIAAFVIINSMGHVAQAMAALPH